MSERLLSPRAQLILSSLTDEFATAGQIARAAGLPTRTRAEAAERVCDALVQDGVAERVVTRSRRRWRKRVK